MFCKNCGVQLSEEVVFCPECGIKQEKEDRVIPVNADEMTEVQEEEKNDVIEQETVQQEMESQQTQIVEAEIVAEQVKYCHNCGSVNAQEDAFCCNCGAAFGKSVPSFEAATLNQSRQKEKKSKGIPFVIAGVLLLAVVLLAAVSLFLNNGSRQSTLAYIKDNELNLFQKKEPYQIGNEIFEDKSWANYYGNVLDTRIQFSDKGKYIFYPQDYDTEGFSLYRGEVNNEKAQAVKVDSYILDYQVISADKVVYIKDSEECNLYVSDLNDKDKIASDVSWFLLSEDKQTVFWCNVDDNGEISLYMQGLDGKVEKTKIASGIEYLYDYTDDLKTIVYEKDNNLYIVKDYGEKEKIASDCLDVYVGLSGSNASIYYLQEGDALWNFNDMFEDKYAESDSWMEYPDIMEYQTIAIEDTFWGPMEYVVTDEVGYQTAVEEYEEKQIRDEIRWQLGLDEDAKIKSQMLYYYDVQSGESTKIQEEFYEYEFSEVDNGILMYSSFNIDKIQKISMDSLVDLYKESEDSLEGLLVDILDDIIEIAVCDGTKQVTLSIDKEKYHYYDSWESMIDPNTNTLYVVIKGDEEEMLYAFDYESENPEGHIIKDDAEYISLEMIGDEGLYYICDETLYLNDEKITDDVSYVYEVYEGKILAVKDSSGDYDSYEYTLYLVDGTEGEKIADDVAYWVCNEEGKIAFLTDYNFQKYRGDLKMYQNGEIQKIDSDVSGIIGFY